MLKELMQSKGMDAEAIVINATEKLIDQYGRSKLDKYNYNGDKLINFLRSNNPNYKQLTDEYCHLHGFAY